MQVLVLSLCNTLKRPVNSGRLLFPCAKCVNVPISITPEPNWFGWVFLCFICFACLHTFCLIQLTLA